VTTTGVGNAKLSIIQFALKYKFRVRLNLRERMISIRVYRWVLNGSVVFLLACLLGAGGVHAADWGNAREAAIARNNSVLLFTSEWPQPVGTGS